MYPELGKDRGGTFLRLKWPLYVVHFSVDLEGTDTTPSDAVVRVKSCRSEGKGTIVVANVREELSGKRTALFVKEIKHRPRRLTHGGAGEDDFPI